MSKTKPLITIIVFLLITNIGMLIYFIVTNKPAEKKQKSYQSTGMYHSLEKEVGFSKDQLDKYLSIRKEQMQKMKTLFNDVRDAKKDFYGLIYSPNLSDSLVNADADSIAKKQKTLDLQMLGYFKNVRNICTPAQRQKFDSTMKKEVARMVDHPGKHNLEHKK